MKKHFASGEYDSCSGHSEENESLKATPVVAFRFSKAYGVKKGVSLKYVNYRPPKLVRDTGKWHVMYYFRVPDDRRHEYPKEWKKFKVYEDINRHKTEEYAQFILKSVESALADGYNPFTDLKPKVKVAEWSLNHGLDAFIVACEEKGLRPKTLSSYRSCIKHLKDYFIVGNRLYAGLSSITKDEIRSFLSTTQKREGWENGTYNSNLGYAGIIFSWFVKEDKIAKSPCVGIEAKKATVNKNKYYSDDLAKKIKAELLKKNPYLHSFCEFIYYTCTRPKSEARLLQVKHLLFERDLIFIPGSISKNKKDDYIPMAPELKSMLEPLKGKSPETYIWGNTAPGEKPASPNTLAAKYKPFKDALGLDDSYSIYSWKHTRAIHLAHAKVDPFDIMKLMRHSSVGITMIYLKELGTEVDWEKYNIKAKF